MDRVLATKFGKMCRNFCSSPPCARGGGGRNFCHLSPKFDNDSEKNHVWGHNFEKWGALGGMGMLWDRKLVDLATPKFWHVAEISAPHLGGCRTKKLWPSFWTKLFFSTGHKIITKGAGNIKFASLPPFFYKKSEYFYYWLLVTFFQKWQHITCYEIQYLKCIVNKYIKI